MLVHCSGFLVLALNSPAGFLILFKSEQLPTVHGKASPCDLVLRRSPQEIPGRFLVFRAERHGCVWRRRDVFFESAAYCRELGQALHGKQKRGVRSPGRLQDLCEVAVASQGNRVVLSGTGGDEVMGGVPTPTPELQDLLARAQFRALAHQLKLWALQKRKPWFHLFWEAARGFFPPLFVGVSKHMRPAPWLQSNFVKHQRAPLTGYPSRVKLFGPLPTFQDNVSTLDGLRRQLARAAFPFEPPFEKRYPCLDRNLLEFMFAIPREQLVRPTQRRSLMRRALVGIVPDEVLNRKNKAFVARAPLVAISRDWAQWVEITQHMVSSSLGIVDPERILDVLQKARRGEEVPMLPLMRTNAIEVWLRNLRTLGIVNLGTSVKPELALQASTQG